MDNDVAKKNCMINWLSESMILIQTSKVLRKKIEDVGEKITNTSGLVKKITNTSELIKNTNYNTKIT